MQNSLDDRQALQRAWAQLEQQALAQIRQGFSPTIVPRRSVTRLLRLLHLPSFEDWAAWELWTTTDDDTVSSPLLVAHRTTWKRTDDGQSVFGESNPPLARLRQKFYGLRDPTIHYQIVTPDAALVHDAIARLTNQSILLRPPMPKAFGLDGTSYELTFGHFWAETTLRCWQEPPEEWGEVGNVVPALRDHLESLREAHESV